MQGKGRIVWNTPNNFEVVFSGNIDDGQLQDGKLLINVNKQNVQTIEGLFNVSLYPTTPASLESSGEETKEQKSEI